MLKITQTPQDFILEEKESNPNLPAAGHLSPAIHWTCAGVKIFLEIHQLLQVDKAAEGMWQGKQKGWSMN